MKWLINNLFSTYCYTSSANYLLPTDVTYCQENVEGSPLFGLLETFFMLIAAEHEIFSSNEFKNANTSWHFHIC